VKIEQLNFYMFASTIERTVPHDNCVFTL